MSKKPLYEIYLQAQKNGYWESKKPPLPNVFNKPYKPISPIRRLNHSRIFYKLTNTNQHGFLDHPKILILEKEKKTRLEKIRATNKKENEKFKRNLEIQNKKKAVMHDIFDMISQTNKSKDKSQRKTLEEEIDSRYFKSLNGEYLRNYINSPRTIDHSDLHLEVNKDSRTSSCTQFPVDKLKLKDKYNDQFPDKLSNLKPKQRTLNYKTIEEETHQSIEDPKTVQFTGINPKSRNEPNTSNDIKRKRSTVSLSSIYHSCINYTNLRRNKRVTNDLKTSNINQSTKNLGLFNINDLYIDYKRERFMKKRPTRNIIKGVTSKYMNFLTNKEQEIPEDDFGILKDADREVFQSFAEKINEQNKSYIRDIRAKNKNMIEKYHRDEILKHKRAFSDNFRVYEDLTYKLNNLLSNEKIEKVAADLDKEYVVG